MRLGESARHAQQVPEEIREQLFGAPNCADSRTLILALSLGRQILEGIGILLSFFILNHLVASNRNDLS